MLKADLHLHTNQSKYDRKKIPYSPKQLIDFMSKNSFDVISITDHDVFTYSEQLRKYAESKGIILLSGMEKTIEGKHILLINFTGKELNKLRKLDDLKPLRNGLIIAPHPFFPKVRGLENKTLKYMHLFDALEYSYFYTGLINFNKKAIRIARQHKKPLIGCSDAHRLWQVGTTYSLIDSKKDKKGIISAIKSGKIIIETKPLPFWTFVFISLYVLMRKPLIKLRIMQEE